MTGPFAVSIGSFSETGWGLSDSCDPFIRPLLYQQKLFYVVVFEWDLWNFAWWQSLSNFAHLHRFWWPWTVFKATGDLFKHSHCFLFFISDHPIALNSALARWKHMIYLHSRCRLWCSAAASVLPYMSVAMLFLPKSIKHSFRMYTAQCQVCLWHIKYECYSTNNYEYIYTSWGIFQTLHVGGPHWSSYFYNKEMVHNWLCLSSANSWHWCFVIIICLHITQVLPNKWLWVYAVRGSF